MYISVDAHGGDNGAIEAAKGCVMAVNEKEGFNIYLVGNEDELNSHLSTLQYDKERIEVVNATQIITMHDKSSTAMREKPDSSLAVAFDLVKSEKAKAIVSAGSTGALLSGAIFKLKRIKGIYRPALAPFIPKLGLGHKKETLILDVGANADCKPEYLLQFAQMASEYLRIVYNVNEPKVGLINIGTEDTKGNELTKAAYDLLSQSEVNFIGNVESREITHCDADILVTDGFTGNVVLKFLEGVSKDIMAEFKGALMGNFVSKIGGALAKGELRKLKVKFDHEETGAAILLGANGGVFKCHGSSHAKAYKNGILQAARFATGDVINKIIENIKL